MLRFLRLLRRALWRAFQHDAFFLAKGAAYSSVLTFFPALLVVASIVALTQKGDVVLGEISAAVGYIVPPGARAAALRYFEGKHHFPVRLLVTTSIITLLAAAGVMNSWMEGFRKAYQLPKTWGMWKQEFIAIALVLLAFIPMTFATLLVASGSLIESWMTLHSGEALGLYILLLWSGIRWVIATLTSIAVITLIYHYGIPRTLPWHSVLPGATLATAMWLLATMGFTWYLKKYATYNLIYGSLGAAIALLVWMYLISVVVLVGAEFNALVYPRPAAKGGEAPAQQGAG